MLWECGPQQMSISATCSHLPPHTRTVTQQALHGDDLQVEYGSAGLPLLRGGKAAQP